MSRFSKSVDLEIRFARKKHGKITGWHDGYGRILEELDEFWEIVKQKDAARSRSAAYRELVQIAAMCRRTAEDLDL